jgi:hypothetical protein
MLHALVLGVLGLAVSIVGAAVTWNKGLAFGPHRYPVALVVLAMPQCWVGGKLYEMQLRARGRLKSRPARMPRKIQKGPATYFDS